MIYLPDTHTLIWSILETRKLSRTARGIIIDRNNEICVSVVSFWEISIKTRLVKFSFNININDFPRYARKKGFSIIDLKESEAITFYELPLKERRKDPFDRMLIWQSIVNDMVFQQRRRVGRLQKRRAKNRVVTHKYYRRHPAGYPAQAAFPCGGVFLCGGGHCLISETNRTSASWQDG